MSNTLAIKNGKEIIYLKYCLECGQKFTAYRADKLSCSDRCRQRITRRKNAHKPLIIDNISYLKQSELKKFDFDKGNVTILENVKLEKD